MDSFEELKALVARFRELGATRIFFKPLSENDNSKQQVYLGGSFEVLTYFPYGAPRKTSPSFATGCTMLTVA